MGLTGTVTLDARGNPNAVFIFQVGSTLTTAPSSTVALINGGSPCNVFWQVGSSATLDTNTTFVGSILALTSVSVLTGTTVDGRVLARNGAGQPGHQQNHPTELCHPPAGGDHPADRAPADHHPADRHRADHRPADHHPADHRPADHPSRWRWR